MALELDPEKLASNPLVVSALGSVLGLKAVPGASWAERLMNALIMFSCGVVLGGSIVEAYGITKAKVAAGVVLLTAASCLVLFQVAVAAVKATDAGKILGDWARKLLGLPSNQQGS